MFFAVNISILTNIHDIDGTNILFLDALFEFLSNKVNNFSEESIVNLFHYIQREEFDTDAINDDILEGNICNAANDKEITRKILEFVNANDGMSCI